jgi:hypothetical protein
MNEQGKSDIERVLLQVIESLRTNVKIIKGHDRFRNLSLTRCSRASP